MEMESATPVYTADIAALSKELKTDLKAGLSAEEAQQRLETYGRNEIASGRRVNAWLIFLHQFKSAVVYLLLFAAALSAFFKEWADVVAILLVILINAVVGFIMEYQAENSMEALRQLTRLSARVFRNGRLRETPVEEVVPGDILFLEAGDLVPADGRIAESASLQVNESALTGESVPVEKAPGNIPADTPLAERTNMLFKGTHIRTGNARMLCTSTGMKTELGAIATMVQEAGKSATPLEKKLESFSKRLMIITVVIVLLIFVAGILNQVNLLDMLKTSIALAVAAIPEGLPIVATLALARGMIRMAKQQVIVKKLSAVETLGATTVICTDKTGTLTENRLELAVLHLPPDQELKPANGNGQTENYAHILKAAILCNNASLEEENGELKETGDPLETSLLRFALSLGEDIEDWRERFRKIKEIPFDSDTRIMGTVHQHGDRYIITAKGATENLLEYCSQVAGSGQPTELTDNDREKWLQRNEQLATEGMKPLAFALRETQEAPGEDFLQSLTFIGLAGFIDPPRSDVKQAIQECRDASIKIMMLTGDHPATARNIAGQLGIGHEGSNTVIVGKDMLEQSQLNDQEKEKWIQAAVFARVTPRQKLDLIGVLQERRHIVAMTGDGVNDAPALKKADIGIAMGIRGTQVSQEVADMVLKDDAFSSIVQAVKQGRIIFDNIRRFITFLLSCNLSELLVIGIIAALNLPFQLVALQILFINLITDVLPALALGVTEGSDLIMKKPPKDPQQPIIDRKRWYAIWAYSAVIAAASLGAAATGMRYDLAPNNILFFTLIFSQLLHVLNMAEGREPFFRNPVFRNQYVWYAVLCSTAITLLSLVIKPLGDALRVSGMESHGWLVVGAFSVASLIVVRVLKKMGVIG